MRGSPACLCGPLPRLRGRGGAACADVCRLAPSLTLPRKRGRGRRRRVFECTDGPRSLLDQRLEPRQRVVPLPRDAIEIVAQLVERSWLERKAALAPDADRAHDAR